MKATKKTIPETPAAISQEQRLDMLIETSKIGVAATHQRLIALLGGLVDRLTYARGRLIKEGPDANINTIGEVQAMGSDIDRHCALLGEQRDMLARLLHFRDGGVK